MDIWEGSRRKYIMAGMVTAGVYFSLKYLSPIFSPFLLAFLMAGFFNKLTKKIHVRIKKSILAGLILLLLGTAFLWLLWWAGCWLMEQGGSLAGQASLYEKEFGALLGKCCDGMEQRFGVDGKAVEDYVLKQVTIFTENLEIKIWPAVMDKSMTYMKCLAKGAGFLAVTVIALFLMLRDFDKLTAFLWSSEDFRGVREVAGKVILYIKTFLKAQVILLGIIGTVCAAVLGLAGINGGVFYGFLTGMMDMLPFVGTGIMLIPLAVCQFLGGSYGRSVLILALYGVCALLREFLEPKLIGDKVGIWPVGILLGVFAGVQLFGIFGIIKGPLGLVIICETCRYLFGDGEKGR